MPNKQDTYDFYDDHAVCHSKSGNTYLITYNPLACNCVGFNYYQYCRHSTHTLEHIKERIQHITSKVDPPVIGDTTATTSAQDDIMHQLIHGNKPY